MLNKRVLQSVRGDVAEGIHVSSAVRTELGASLVAALGLRVDGLVEVVPSDTAGGWVGRVSAMHVQDDEGRRVAYSSES